ALALAGRRYRLAARARRTRSHLQGFELLLEIGQIGCFDLAGSLRIAEQPSDFGDLGFDPLDLLGNRLPDRRAGLGSRAFRSRQPALSFVELAHRATEAADLMIQLGQAPRRAPVAGVDADQSAQGPRDSGVAAQPRSRRVGAGVDGLDQ